VLRYLPPVQQQKPPETDSLCSLVIVVFGFFIGAFSIVLFEIGLNLGWVYLFHGVIEDPLLFLCGT
jgi:hypothetical protein